MSLLENVSPAVDHKPLRMDLFDLGLIDNVAPTDPRLAGRAALFCRNVNYDRRTIAKRKGIERVCENAPGAVQIATFEVGETWTASGITVAADTDYFIKREVAGTGTQGRRLTISTSPPIVVPPGDITESGLSLDLSGHLLDVFSLWIRPVTVPTDYLVKVAFQTSAGNEYVGTFAEPSPGNRLIAAVGRYHRIKRYQFAATGTPDWTNITAIRIILTLVDGASLVLTVDNLTLGPGRGQDLFQFRRLTDPTYKGSKNEYAVVDGRLYRLNGELQVWTDMGLFFDPDAEVNHVTLNDRMYLCDGVSKNLKIMPDGVTTYQMGIDTITSPVTATAVTSGGSLVDGTHRFAITYYSKITGVESAPHIRVGQEVTISGAGGSGSIVYSGIPRSTDPQVTHVRIYRMSPVSTEFRRVSASADGELVNGQTTFTDSAADSALADEMDPDKDAPGPAKFFAPWPELGILLACFSASPSVVNFSSPADGASPENWPIENAVAVGRDENDVISGLHYDSLRGLVFKPTAILEGYHVGGDEFIRFRTIKTDRGSMSHKAILTVENRTYYPGPDGVYALDASNAVRKVTNLQQNTWDGEVFHERLNRSCAVQLRSRYQYILYFNGKGAAQNNLAWKVHHNSVLVDKSFDKGLGPGHTAASSIDEQSAVSATEVEVSNEIRETWILSADGQVYRIDVGPTDDGKPIVLRHRTALLSPSGGDLLHQFPYLGMEFRQSSAEDLTVRVWYDYSLGAPVAERLAALSGAGGEPYGSFIFGTSYLGASYGHQKKVKLPPRNARWVMFEFEQGGIADAEIYRLRLWNDTDGQVL